MRSIKERKKLGNNIKQIRISKQISRKELSLLSLVNYTTLMNIENGKINPRLDTLIRLSIFLDKSMKELFDYE